MTDEVDLEHLSELVRLFEEADAHAVKATVAALRAGRSDIPAWTAVFDSFKDALNAKNRVKDFVGGHRQVPATGALREQLLRIRKNEGYFMDTLAKVLEEDQTELTEDDVEELHDDLGLSLEEDEDIFRRSRRVGAVLTTATLPPVVMENLAQVRACFSTGLFSAAIVFCRAVVEAALYEAVNRKGLLRGPDGARSGVAHMAEWSPKMVRDLALQAGLVPRAVWQPVFVGNTSVVRLANDVLHTKREPVPPSEGDAFRCIDASINLLEALFRA